MRISLVVTVRDEEETVPAFLESVRRQTLRPSEVVIVDGGSRDGTVAAIRRCMKDGAPASPVRLILLEEANIARGRNRGISDALGDVVAVSDAGCVLDERWLEEITAPFRGEDVLAVGGSYRVETRGLWGAAVRAMTIPSPDTVARDLPSSRSFAFRKELWRRVGGYPEDLDWGEDTALVLAVKRLGVPIRFAPRAIVHWSPRGSPVATFTQYLHYAIGDGKAGHFRRHYLVRAVGLLSIIVLIAWGAVGGRMVGWVLALALVAVYWLAFVLKVPPGMRIARDLFLSLPALLVSDSARVIGYLWGTIGRWMAGQRRPWN